MHVIISVGEEKGFDKTHHPFIMNALNTLERDRKEHSQPNESHTFKKIININT